MWNEFGFISYINLERGEMWIEQTKNSVDNEFLFLNLDV